MIVAIANPAAGRGKGIHAMRALESVIPGFGANCLLTTRTEGDERRLVKEALSRGAKTIVVLGGDGTCSKVADEIISARADCRLAVIPSGTGNDFAKTLGVDAVRPLEAFQLATNGNAARVDVGQADGHYFINSCGFGFAASVLEASNRVRFLKGDAVYIYSALRQLFTYRGIEVSANGVPGVKNGPMLMVTVSNGRSLGGAFKIAPNASVLDGKLDACFLSDSNVVRRVRLFVGAMRGTHIGMPSVFAASVPRLALTFPSSPLMEMDGELRKARSSTVELTCVPRALSVVAVPGALV
jgi:diacylglycerol kinase (ATP)